jgi:hypothetical protein
MFLALLLALIGVGLFYSAISLGWHGPGFGQWRFLLLPAAGLLLGAWFAWPR